MTSTPTPSIAFGSATSGDPRIDAYDWPGGSETMLRFGPEKCPVVVVALPLFEEANRTRAFVVSVLRLLARRGIASVLPDLPGQGESTTPTERADLTALRDAFAAVAATIDAEGCRTYGFAVRSGALLDTSALMFGRWHLAPMEGSEVLRDLARVRRAATGEAFDPALHFGEPDDPPIEFAGNLLSPWMLAGLAGATPFAPGDGVPLRIVRLPTDPRPADHVLSGTPLWRRSEPGNDPAMAERIAGDIADWISACDAI